MASTVDVYKGVNKLGSGSAAADSATISSYTATTGVVTGAGRNVSLTITEAGDNIGRTWNTRVLADGGTSLTLNDVCPFVGA